MTEMDWIVDTHTTIRPDLMVAREPLGTDRLRHAPHLVLDFDGVAIELELARIWA